MDNKLDLNAYFQQIENRERITDTDVIYVLENLLFWWPEVQLKLSDAEREMFRPVIEKTQQILLSR